MILLKLLINTSFIFANTNLTVFILNNHKNFFMTMRTNCILLLVILLGAFPLSVHADESGSIILYTPYTKISVTPGASIDYSIDLINNTDGVTNANLSVSGLPGSWKHEIKSGGWTLSQLSVLPQERKRSI